MFFEKNNPLGQTGIPEKMAIISFEYFSLGKYRTKLLNVIYQGKKIDQVDKSAVIGHDAALHFTLAAIST